MFKMSFRNTFIAAGVLASLGATPLRADSLWLGEGTLFRLEARGAARTLVVAEPSQETAALGLQAGTVVFAGKRNGAVYSGTFFDCGAEGVRLEGRVVDEVTVVFDAPKGAKCDGLLKSGFALRFTERASAKTEDVDNRAKGGTSGESAETTVKAVPQALAPQTGGTLWQANGLVLRLLASGRGRQLSVDRAPPESGLIRGTVLFEGRRDGQTYKGRLFDPLSDCPAGTEIGAKALITGETRILLSAVDLPSCASGLFRAPLDLSLIGKDEPALAAAAPMLETQSASDAAPVSETASAQSAPAAGAASGPAASTAPRPAQAEIPAKACHPAAAAQNLSLAACRGLLSGLRITEGALPEAEADRETGLASASGVTDLQRAVDAACYPSAGLATFAAGLELARTQTAQAEALRPICIDALAYSERVPAADRIALSGGDGLAAQVWASEQGLSCKGHKVLRLTPAGIFEGRYGAESVAPNAAVLDWNDDGTALQAKIAIHSELVTAPDVLLLVAATRSDTGLSLEIIRQQITPLSRYTRSPEYESDRMTGIWYPCTP